MKKATRRIRPTKRLSAGSHRMFVALDYVCLVGITAHACFIPLFWLLGVPLLAAVNVLSVAAWIVARLVNRRGKMDLAVVLIKLEVAAHATLACTLLGWDSGFHYYLWPLIPFAALNERISPRIVFIEVVALFVLYSVLYWFTRQIQFTGPSPQVTESIPFMNVGVVFTAMGMLAVYYRLATTAAEERLRIQASTDDLTGLTNRRRMLEYINEELKRIRRSGRDATLVMADIDHFKQINDKHGHQCGDAVLVGVADELRAKLRSQDFIARWGGEEFLFLLPETDMTGAQIAAEKLREAISACEIEFDDRKLSVTMTFGIAPLDTGAGIDESISRADDALYRGKQAGRNRVMTWQIPETEPVKS
ncbi:MAG: GGDEF domain-containing protein [Planctomycetes bacterium]|nr:GGDEF domain-containing protein [Planctomycetota bacterium]MCB9935018.1 GGDEF domain-containing protein [Planctomycetota bacterium]